VRKREGKEREGGGGKRRGWREERREGRTSYNNEPIIKK